MSNPEYWKAQRKLEQSIEQGIILPVRQRLAPWSRNRWWAPRDDPRYVVQTTFEEHVTAIGNGIDLRSNTPGREVLYERSIQWFLDHSVSWHALQGVGIEWTLIPGLGTLWYGMEHMGRVYDTLMRCQRRYKATIAKVPTEHREIYEHLLHVNEETAIAARRHLDAVEASYDTVRLLEEKKGDSAA